MGHISAVDSKCGDTDDSTPETQPQILELVPVRRRRTPVSLEAVRAAELQIQTPSVEAAAHAAPKSQPLRPSVASQGVVGGLDARSPLTLKQRQQLYVLGDRAPKTILGNEETSPPSRHAKEIREGEAFSKISYQKVEEGVEGEEGGRGNSLYNINKYRACVGAGGRGRARSTPRAKKLTPRAAVGSRSQMAERARQLAGERRAGTAAPSKGLPGAYHVAVAYERCLGAYRAKPGLRYLSGAVAPGQPNYATWAAAARCADELGMDYLTYVRAQFWFFERWFSRAAKPQELRPSTSEAAKVPAQERARAYAAMLEAGEVARDTDVTAKGQPAAPTPVRDRVEYSERNLRQLCEAHDMPVADVFRHFARGPIAAAFFDRAWLMRHPVYRDLRDAGEV